MESLKNELNHVRRLINAELSKILSLPNGRESRVVEAMRYSAIGTGKALRPFLVQSVGKLLGVPPKTLLRIGCAIELLHTYSLIHDDLPAMDNDTMRRGKPTNHIQYDEATAILAGDALQTLAFEVLSDSETSPDSEIRIRLVQALAKAAGMAGMVGGQMLDLIGEKSPLTLSEIKQMQNLKTGALLWFSCMAPTMVVYTTDEQKKAIENYARSIGLLFQITDDILDVEGDSTSMGKTLGKDAQANKSTFVSLLGIEKAKAMASELSQQAIQSISIFGEESELLKKLVIFMIERKN